MKEFSIWPGLQHWRKEILTHELTIKRLSKDAGGVVRLAQEVIKAWIVDLDHICSLYKKMLSNKHHFVSNKQRMTAENLKDLLRWAFSEDAKFWSIAAGIDTSFPERLAKDVLKRYGLDSQFLSFLKNERRRREKEENKRFRIPATNLAPHP